MVRERAGIVLRAVGPGGQTDQSGDPREQSEKSATGDFHGPIRLQNRGFGKGPAAICSYENLSGPTFLDFWGVRGFNARNLRKEVLFDPPPGPRGRRSTPDSAMRPRAQKCLEYRSPAALLKRQAGHKLNGHHPPPGLAFGGPDDRLRRVGTTAVTDDLILRSRAAASRRMGHDYNLHPSRRRLRLLLRVRQQEDLRVRQSVGKAWWHTRSADPARLADGSRRRCGDARSAPRAIGSGRVARCGPELHR